MALDSDQERRLREVEILATKTEASKEELSEKIKEYKDEQHREFQALKKQLDDNFELYNERLSEQRTHIYKILGTFGSIITLILGFLFTMNAEKVSNASFNMTITQISKTQEKQLEMFQTMQKDLNQLTIDVGIIKSKLEKK